MAYQGKFSQPRNAGDKPAKETPKVKVTPVQEPVPEVQETAPVKQPEPRAAAPAQPKTPAPAEAPKKADPAAPAKNAGKKKKKKKKKANRNVTIVFYTVYCVMIAAFLVGMFFLNSWLNNFLTNYEASQPTTRCEEVFQEHFATPDWAKLYTMAGLSDTVYEGADDFAAYMAEKAAGQELTYVETSAGLSGGRKYLLKLGSETLGYFTLKDNAPEGADLPDWQLDQVKLSAAYSNTVLIQTSQGRTVSVNGVALEDDHIIQISTTLAEDYLPKGVSAPITYLYQLEGLMTKPDVVITDEEGNVSSVVYDETSGMYIEQTDANTMGSEEEEAALTAAQVYAKYMIEEASYGQLAKHFDGTSQIYKTITSMTLWMQGHDGYEFANEEVSQFCRYSDNCFSARVALSLNVTRKDGTVKEYTVDSTLFLKKISGKWKVYEMTNVDVSAPIAEVRLTFKLEDHVVFTNLYDNDVDTIKTSTVTAPEGKIFDGWYKLVTAPDGSAQYTLVFPAAQGDTITLPEGTVLEPMTLYALFVNAE